MTSHIKLLQKVIDETPKAVLGLVLLSTVYIWTYKDFLPFFYLFVWIVLQSIFITLRFLHSKFLQKAINENNEEKIKKLTVQFFFLILYSAILWNITVILSYFYAPASYEFLSLIMIAGAITAGIISLLPAFKTYMTYFFLLAIPQLLILQSYQTHIHTGALLLLCIYIPLVFLLSKSRYQNFLQEMEINENLEKNVEKLHQLSITDELTQVYNRRYFLETAQNLLSISLREDKPLSLLMMDIDYFKSINDTYGHHIGDEVLKKVANILKSSLRKSDILARVGGEEFALLLQNTSLEGAKVIGEKLRILIESHNFDFDVYRLNMTISIGVATTDLMTQNFDILYKNADKNLYLAKQAGRNQVK